MSIDAAVAFWQHVDGNPSLQKQIDLDRIQSSDLSTLGKEFQELSDLANRSGYQATPSDFRAAEAVKRFWMHVDQDEKLQKELLPAQALDKAHAAAFVQGLATRSGYDVTVEELQAVSRAALQGPPPQGTELDEAQLGQVAGGVTSTLSSSRYYYYYRTTFQTAFISA